MNLACLFTDASTLRVEDLQVTADTVVVTARSIQPQACCPRRQRSATRVHSRYRRRLADVPWQGRRVQLVLHVRRFFCEQTVCPRRIFCERLAVVALPYARRTLRLNRALEAVGFAVGGEPGARLAGLLGMPTSPDTLLRRVRQAQPLTTPAPYCRDR
jgi:transposase IS204/IS1001/IS1096/IS1165 family protein